MSDTPLNLPVIFGNLNNPKMVTGMSDERIEALSALVAEENPEVVKSRVADMLREIRSMKAQLIVTQEKLDQTQELAQTDSLTGIANRRNFLGCLDRAVEEMRRMPHMTAALMLFDLDEFKAINDRYGHQAGDEALAAFANFLKEHARSHECAARTGGDEFHLLLLGEKGEDFFKGAEARLNNQLSTLSLEYKGHKIPIRASIGAIEIDSDMLKRYGTAEVVLHEADERMYACKQARKLQQQAGTDIMPSAPMPDID